jgi:hypothetical protein
MGFELIIGFIEILNAQLVIIQITVIHRLVFSITVFHCVAS